MFDEPCEPSGCVVAAGEEEEEPAADVDVRRRRRPRRDQDRRIDHVRDLEGADRAAAPWTVGNTIKNEDGEMRGDTRGEGREDLPRPTLLA